MSWTFGGERRVTNQFQAQLVRLLVAMTPFVERDDVVRFQGIEGWLEPAPPA
jgi:hypothetical protein